MNRQDWNKIEKCIQFVEYEIEHHEFCTLRQHQFTKIELAESNSIFDQMPIVLS